MAYKATGIITHVKIAKASCKIKIKTNCIIKGENNNTEYNIFFDAETNDKVKRTLSIDRNMWFDVDIDCHAFICKMMEKGMLVTYELDSVLKEDECRIISMELSNE